MENLNKLIKENPEALELDVISDALEGFCESVDRKPQFSHRDGGLYYTQKEIEEDLIVDCDGNDFKINAVCIN